MPRPKRPRRICEVPKYTEFSPLQGGTDEVVHLTLDEYEVLRVIDYEKQNQESCAKHMDISRTTVAEIYDKARFKLMDSMIHGKKLVVDGGNYEVCGGNCATECMGCVKTTD